LLFFPALLHAEVELGLASRLGMRQHAGAALIAADFAVDHPVLEAADELEPSRLRRTEAAPLPNLLPSNEASEPRAWTPSDVRVRPLRRARDRPTANRWPIVLT